MSAIFEYSGSILLCPTCGSAALRKEQRSRWMRMIPTTQRFICCRCRSSALMVFGRLLPMDGAATCGDSVDHARGSLCRDRNVGRVRLRATSDSTYAQRCAPNRGAEVGFNDSAVPPDLEPPRNGVGDLPSIATMAEMGDPRTVCHEARVAELAMAIARLLGLPERSVAALGAASRVHDLGKVWIPPEVLGSSEKLIPAEMDLVKLHPQMGCEILQAAEFSSPFAEIILQHHERLDGSGYPRGMTAGQILPEAKILAVADVVEAMTSARPHRPSLGIEAALEEIRRGSGIVYDEHVVEACLRLFRRK